MAAAAAASLVVQFFFDPIKIAQAGGAASMPMSSGVLALSVVTALLIEEERPRRLCELLSEAAGRDGGVEGGEENQNILDAIEARLAELKPLAGASCGACAKPSAATLLQGYDELVSAEALPIAAELPPRIATELHATRQRTEALLV
eukprot:g14251.t1